MLPITAEIVDAAAGIAAFAGEWDALFDASRAEPTTSLEWTRALLRNYLGDRDRAFVVRLARGGSAIGFVPLLVRPGRLFRERARLQPISDIFNTHSDLLIEPSAEAIDALLDAVHGLDAGWDLFRLSRMLEQNPIAHVIAERAQGRGLICSTAQSRPAFHLPLPATFEDYFAGRSAKFRNHARRMEKKLRAAGAVGILEVTAAAEFEAAYDAFLEVERASWKDSRGISINAAPRRTAFFREWGHAAAMAGRLHLQLLTLDATPIAHNIGYLRAGCYYYLKTSYAAACRPLSPATFLRLRLIESLIAKGVTLIDLPGNPYDWERQWTDQMRPQVAINIYPRTLRGRVLAWRDRRRSAADPAPVAINRPAAQSTD